MITLTPLSAFIFILIVYSVLLFILAYSLCRLDDAPSVGAFSLAAVLAFILLTALFNKNLTTSKRTFKKLEKYGNIESVQDKENELVGYKFTDEDSNEPKD